jgi:septum formation protein
MKQIILASQSPRRKEILTMLGFEVQVIPPGYEERMPETTSDPAGLVMTFAQEKVADVIRRGINGLVIGADTIIAKGERIYGKPADRNDAIAMLSSLIGATHQVYTGYSLCDTRTGKNHTAFDVASVTVGTPSSQEIAAYVDLTEPYDKSGSYAVQGPAAVFIQKIEGDYFTIMGLPVFKLGHSLQEFGISLLLDHHR